MTNKEKEELLAMKDIRCKECGHIIAKEIEPIKDGSISIMCNNRKANGQRCKTVNIINNTPKN